MAGRRGRTGTRVPPDINPETGEPFEWSYQVVRPRELPPEDPCPYVAHVFPAGRPMSQWSTWCCTIGHPTHKQASRHARYVIGKGRVRLVRYQRDWNHRRHQRLKKRGIVVPYREAWREERRLAAEADEPIDG
jgi:hypothetical protein